MQRGPIVTGFVIVFALTIAYPAQTHAKRPTGIRSLQEKIIQVESEMESLPNLFLNPSPWTLGYRSNGAQDADQPIIIDVWFTTPAPIDLIALLPTTYAPASGEVAAFGFPERFTIERLLQDGSREIIVDHSQQDYAVTGIEPQLFHLAKPVFADGLRITVLQQSENPTWWNYKFVTVLSELFAFSGDWNVALDAQIDASSARVYGYVWHPNCLTDGFCAFSPVKGKKLHNPLENYTYFGNKLTLNFDLGQNHRVDELRLWPFAPSLQYNFPHASGVGFPGQIHLELLADPNAVDGQTLINSDPDSRRPGSSPLMLRFPPAHGRYFRLTLRNPMPEFRTDIPTRFNLSEIEILEQGQVRTRGLQPSRRPSKSPETKLKRLTDGQTSEGHILPLRAWVEGLSRRALLGRKLNALQQDLDFAQRQERERLFSVILFSICITPVLIGLAKLMADRRWKRVRDRIACDLHDEIGANLSSLTHMAELIKETIPEPTTVQDQLLNEAIDTARLTSGETRNFIQLLEVDKSGFDLSEQIGKVALQILGNIDFTCELEARPQLARLRAYKQWDLLLFVKEALNNIVKHADASHVDILIRRNSGRILLSISDNGRGLPDERLPLRHLETRAKNLKANLNIESVLGQGTRILLNFK